MTATATFAYLRVSTAEQTVENQRQEIEASGYQPRTVYSETVSGKSAAAQRPEFAKLLDVIACTSGPKELVVTKLDRLGRNAMDVRAMIDRLGAMDCGVVVLQLGKLDLTSAAGKMTLTVLAAVAEMERDLLVERTQAGLARAKAEGKQLGRPPALAGEKAERARQMLAEGVSMVAVAKELKVARGTVAKMAR